MYPNSLTPNVALDCQITVLRVQHEEVVVVVRVQNAEVTMATSHKAEF